MRHPLRKRGRGAGEPSRAHRFETVYGPMNVLSSGRDAPLGPRARFWWYFALGGIVGTGVVLIYFAR